MLNLKILSLAVDICFHKKNQDMKKINEDPELEFELQEVFLTVKQWQSDLAFLEDEAGFLTEQISGTAHITIAATSQHHLAARLANARRMHSEIGEKRDEFNKQLEPLLRIPNPTPDLKLLEEFVSLQAAVDNALNILKGIKYALVEARRAA